LAQDLPIVDAARLVTRRTGCIQGLIELKNAKAGDTGRFALSNVAESTRNVVVNLPPGEFTMHVYRAFYQVPPARSVTVLANHQFLPASGGPLSET
jgi:hypothetical protein